MLTMYYFTPILNLKLTVNYCKKTWKHLCNGRTIGKWSLTSKLGITNKKNPLVFNYCIASKPIRQVSHTKYLGVTIASDLSWNKHVQTITNKATQTNNLLYRDLRQCPTHIKCSCYKIMVRPIVEYAVSVWDPHTLCNIGKIESRGARFCFNDFSRFSSVTEMLSSLNLPSLQSRRSQAKLITLTALYKIINGFLTAPTHDLVPKSQL